MGVDKLRAAVRSAVPAVAVAAASSAVEMDRSKQAMSAWKSQRLSKSVVIATHDEKPVHSVLFGAQILL